MALMHTVSHPQPASWHQFMLLGEQGHKSVSSFSRAIFHRKSVVSGLEPGPSGFEAKPLITRPYCPLIPMFPRNATHLSLSSLCPHNVTELSFPPFISPPSNFSFSCFFSFLHLNFYLSLLNTLANYAIHKHNTCI